MSYSLASKEKNASFHELFPTVPADDHLITRGFCYLASKVCFLIFFFFFLTQDESLINGYLYLSENHICFAPWRSGISDVSLLSFWSRSGSSQVTNDKLRQNIIPISKITTLNKENNAIQLSTGQVKYTFTFFYLSRDRFCDLIHNIWRSVAQPFHSTMLPNLQVSVCCALTTFESGISQWIHPSEWLNANVKHIREIFDGIVDLTGNKTMTFPATMIFQVC